MSPANASTSSAPSSSASDSIPRPQAGPLPSKRGEIGFVEEIHGGAPEDRPPSPIAVPLPARHPADRDPVPSPPSTAPTANNRSNTSLTSPSSESISSTSTSSLPKHRERRKLFAFLKLRRGPTYYGIHLTTFVAFIIQLLLVSATLAAWIISIQMLSNRADAQQSRSENQNDPPAESSAIFVHIVFGIASLGQLLFIERRIFRLRAERYAFKHPGEILPSARRRRGPDPHFPLSPWNRPPLPTYAAALAQSGVGTGDVEDHLIAAPPPPAYGNTRGSTMILAGFLRDSLRAQRPLSARTEASQSQERPLSYASQDSEWEIIQDAHRARQLEDTLATLERPNSQTVRR